MTHLADTIPSNDFLELGDRAAICLALENHTFPDFERPELFIRLRYYAGKGLR